MKRYIQEREVKSGETLVKGIWYRVCISNTVKVTKEGKIILDGDENASST